MVGGGPAGAAAAASAARQGLRVTLVDKARFPRDKICGDGLTTGALRELEALGLDPSRVPSWCPVDRVHLSGPSRHTVVLPLPRDAGLYAAVARRVELDAAVLDLARAAGAEVREATGVRDVTLGVDDVTLHLEGGHELRARYVIAADGMWSRVRRALALDQPGYRGDWHAFRQYVHDVSAPAATDLHVWFEPDFLPGYVWSFPVAGGGANIGFGIRRGGPWSVQSMARLWTEILARPHIRAVVGPDARPEGPHRAWPIPASIDRQVLSAGRVLFVGDAAAAADPLTGEGIGQALASGRQAAEAVRLGGPDRADRVRALYETAVGRSLVPDHRMSSLLGRAMSHRKGARAGIWLAGMTPWTSRNFARWLFEDYPRALLCTPRRWHRGMFVGPGTYRTAPVPAPPPGEPLDGADAAG